MRVPLHQIHTPSSLPAETDVVVIGAGIIGVCTAYYLNARGLSVALLEKGLIGAEQSSRNWGWCRQQNRDARELPMATKSLALWDKLSETIGPELGFRRCGLLYLSNDEAELETWAKWRDFAKTHDVVSHVLSSSEAQEKGQATGKPWKGGVFSPTDGIANPASAAPLIAKAFVANGGHALQNCAVRGVEKSGGRLSAVVTERGVIKTKVAIMAGGSWASSFCNQLGISFPQSSVRSSILSVLQTEGLPDALHTKQVSVTARGDGGHTLAISGKAQMDPTLQTLRFSMSFLPMFLKRMGSIKAGGLQALRMGHETRRKWALDKETPMERVRILDPAPNLPDIQETLRRAKILLPALEQCEISAAWGGYIDSTPDGVPAIGETDLPGFILAAGFSGHGFGIGPGAGHLIADLVSGSEPILDPKPYDPSRFNRSSWGKVSDF